MEFAVNQEFSSWEEVINIIEAYEKKNFMKFVVGSSSTVENANRKIQLANKGESLYKQSLKYQNIKLTCKHGGRRRIGTGRGIRLIQSTFKLDCKAYFHFIATKDKLRLVKFQLTHSNHDLAEENWIVLPENRNLNAEAEKKAELLFKGGVKPCVVRSLLCDMNEGIITAKDLANLRAKWKAKEAGNLTQEEKLSKTMTDLQEKDPGCKFFVSKDDKNDMKFIFVQTSKMRENVIKYGKVVLLDHTYNINQHKMPVTVFIVSDERGNGRSAGYAFVANKTLTTVTEVVRVFRDCLPEKTAEKVKTLVIDKDPSEIGDIREVFPAAHIQICKFHASHSMKEVCAIESPEVREQVEALKNAKTQEEFDQCVKQLEQESFEKFFAGFKKNWLQCTEAWAAKDKKLSLYLGSLTNKRVENCNSKLKKMLNRHMTLAKALEKLVELVENKEEDVLFVTTMENLKETYTINDTSPGVNQMLKDLTRYAAKLQIWELTNIPSSEEIEFFNANEQSCDCTHRWSFKLPCRHMYQCRRESAGEDSAYTLTEIEPMWHKKGNTTSALPSLSTCHLRTLPSRAPKAGHERYMVASQLFKELACMMSECGANDFSDRLNVMKEIQRMWAEGNDFKIIRIVGNQEEVVALSKERLRHEAQENSLHALSEPVIEDMFGEDPQHDNVPIYRADNLEEVFALSEDIPRHEAQENSLYIKSEPIIVDLMFENQEEDVALSEERRRHEAQENSLHVKSEAVIEDMFGEDPQLDNVPIYSADNLEEVFALSEDIPRHEAQENTLYVKSEPVIVDMFENQEDDVTLSEERRRHEVQETSLHVKSETVIQDMFGEDPQLGNDSIYSTGATLNQVFDGLKIPPVVKTKGRPQGIGKTFQRKYKIKPPAGAKITPLDQDKPKRKKSRVDS